VEAIVRLRGKAIAARAIARSEERARSPRETRCRLAHLMIDAPRKCAIVSSGVCSCGRLVPMEMIVERDADGVRACRTKVIDSISW
jgi:hypothetical protein